MKRSWVTITGRLLQLTGALVPYLTLTVILGVAGFLCAIFLLVFGASALIKVWGIPVAYSLSLLVGGMLAFAVLRGGLRYGEQLCGHYVAFRLLAILRERVFSSLRRLAPAKLETREKGNLISVITSDIELLEVFYAHTIAPVLIAVVTSILMVIFIGTRNPLLGGIAALAYATVGVFIPLMNSRLGRNKGEEYRKAFGEANSAFLERLRGMRELIRFGQGAAQRRIIEENEGELDRKQTSLKRGEGAVKATTDMAVLLFSAGVLFTALSLFEKGELGIVDAVVASTAMFSSFGPVVAISSLSNNLLHTMASGNRVLDLLDEAPAVEEAEATPALETFTGADCDEINFAYQEKNILEKVKLDIPRNRIIGITGKSGSGKSTLMKLLMRFWDVDQGEVRISGRNIKTIPMEDLRRLESYVTQDTFLFDATIEDNIKIAHPEASSEEVADAARKAGIHDFIKTLPKGYGTDVGELGNRLSSGERQRIGLARTFLHNAPFILLDEPTSNLDGFNEAVLLNSLKQQSWDKTILLVSHRESTVSIAQQIYRMDEGRVS